ncbi:MAG: hypothetical protein ABS81_08050 [Pseudonocardia sp. SCN 72-86]|nr:MAG: hypothetical protein ABS81_08050 [Pseudonocardia sp. SCN 72-86]
MHSRQEVEPETLKRIASQIAGIPISNKEAAEHALAVEAFMQEVDALRRLPLKDIAPPLVFAPERHDT